MEVSDLGDEDAKSYLGGIDADLSHWWKMTTNTFLDSNGHGYQIHFYGNTALQRAAYGRGFKVRFTQVFYP